MTTWKFEVTWTIIPFLIGLGIFAWSAEVFFHIQTPPANAMRVAVVGKQWMWKLQHEEGNREIDELHVPLGRPVMLTMTSQDVIHDFFIPAFRVKEDVVPGRYTTEWFVPTKLGRYHIFCAQYCGTSHASMVGWVDVMEPADYEKWLVTTGQGVSMIAEGERIFNQAGCSGCHGASSKIHAPRLEGVYGHPVPLDGGQVVMADDKYIRDSIMLPASQIVAGYQNIMPSFAGHLSEEEVMELIAYIKSLSDKQRLGLPAMNTTEATPETADTENYLSDHRVRSWLLTTDHKRIGILYLLSILVFFAIAAVAAGMMRLQLLSPDNHLVLPETYNKLFTIHGVLMVWFFLIPSIPSVLGNFVIPMMIGARDVAFPRLNLLSWYLFITGGAFVVYSVIVGGVDTGWTFYTPYSTTYANPNVITMVAGVFIAGFSSILTGLNFIVTIHKMRAPGMTWFRLPLFIWSLYSTSLILVLATPVLAITLACDRHRTHLARRHLRSESRGRSGALPAHVLVLLPPSGLHHDPAGDGSGERTDHLFLAEADFRLLLHRVLERGDRGDRIPGLGTPHVREQPVDLRGHGVFDPEFHRRGALGDQGLQLDGDALQGFGLVRHADALRAWRSSACSRLAVSPACSWRRWRWTFNCTTLTS